MQITNVFINTQNNLVVRGNITARSAKYLLMCFSSASPSLHCRLVNMAFSNARAVILLKNTGLLFCSNNEHYSGNCKESETGKHLPRGKKKKRMFECLLLLNCHLPCYIYMEWRDIYWALFLKLNLIHNLLRIFTPKITMTSELANQNFEQKFGNHASLGNCWQAVLRSAGSDTNVCESSPTFPWCRLLRKTRLDMLDFNIPNFLFYQKKHALPDYLAAAHSLSL